MGRPRRFANLAEYLKCSGQTQADVAKAAGVSQAAISRYLLNNGTRGRRDMRLSVAVRLAKYCRIPIKSLVVTSKLVAPKRRRAAAA